MSPWQEEPGPDAAAQCRLLLPGLAVLAEQTIRRRWRGLQAGRNPRAGHAAPRPHRLAVGTQELGCRRAAWPEAGPDEGMGCPST